MSKEHLLQRLQPVDFRAAAERGAFVYCYLRSADLSPYYVGIASEGSWKRPIERHSVAVPKDRLRIRLMKSELTWEQACAWEVRFIAHYGRKDLKTGILRNLTDGGDGVPGLVRSEEDKRKKSQAAKSRYQDPAERLKTSRSQQGAHTYRQSPEWRAAMSERLQGRDAWNQGLTVADPRIRKAVDVMTAGNKDRIWTDEERQAHSLRLKGIKKSEEMREALARTKAQPTADAAEMDVDDYLALDRKAQLAVRTRLKHGLSGSDLLLPSEIDVRLIKKANAIGMDPVKLHRCSLAERRRILRKHR